MFRIKFCLCLILSFCPILLHGQKQKAVFRDSLDNKLDMSDWVITLNGFIPIPYLITEPALGNIGGALFPVFVDLNEPYTDTINGEVVHTRVKPNIYGGGAAYTANGTWLVAGAAMGTIRKLRMNYRLATGYANVNLEFYRELANSDEESFEFNIKTVPVYGQMIKQIGRSSWFAGLNYLFLKTELKLTNYDFHTQDDVSSAVSKLGVLVEYDSRDNIFTPDKGFRWNTLVAASDEAIGSDYDYTSLSSAAYWWLPLQERIIAGFRLEYQQTWGDAPFYLLPYVNMRGIPVMRYQGNITALAETEWRWDLTSRYSLVTYGGTAKAFNDDSSFENADWRFSGGAGFRYLLARKLKLRTGLDVARGPEDWAYYIVFGTTWVR